MKHYKNGDKISILDSDDITWKIEENPENGTFTDRPVAYEGTKCLQLSAKGERKDVAGALEFSCTPQNQTGKLSETKANKRKRF